MTIATSETTTSQPRPFPIARLDLEEEIRQLRASPRPGDHLAKTLLHNADLRMVLMILDGEARIPSHQARGSLTLHVLEGRVVASVREASFDLGPGEVLAIARDEAHGLVAIEDSALLLTIAH
ncbi:MAG TPA: cupin domain-containing protein [Kofleriaceae bacterium]|nr:cupin domain-containing protein [Kofleriaceae bacterium]